MPGATIAFTLLYAHRNNHFIHDFHRFVTSSEMSSELWQTSFDCLGIADETVAMYLLLFRLLFVDYDFVVETPVKYRDTQSMLLFILRDFQIGNSEIREGAREYFEKFMDSQLASLGVSTVSTKKGTLAAKKAWKTRRALKRSNAATRAWETRRANAQAKKRSEAAKKAWSTRRAAAEQETVV